MLSSSIERWRSAWREIGCACFTIVSLALLTACGAHVPASPGATSTGAGGTVSQPMQRVTYSPDDRDFANPERGFSKPWRNTRVDARALNLSLVHLYFRLDDYRNAPLPADVLKMIEGRFAEVRASGVKAVPRFTYSFPRNGDYSDTDAPLSRVVEHLAQLEPILRENSDVIAYMEAGFVGAWGEWHNSSHGLNGTEPKSIILRRLLAILPKSRAVAVRTQHDKIAIFGRSTAITAQEAFGGSDVARVGHHNDCFLASPDNWGTYRLDGPRSLQEQKEYLRAENQYLPQGGETCNAAADAQPLIQCSNALAELELLRWSQLNINYHPEVIGLWRSQGCLPEIAKRLGYRFRLLMAALSRRVEAGRELSAEIELVNDGFASPYNPRSIELVLRHRTSRCEYAMTLDYDPRRWLGSEKQILTIRARLPADMRPGLYDAYLNLPDPAPRLRGRPEYSIRLANLQMWEESTGYNRLGLSVAVEPFRGTAPLGASPFTSKCGEKL